MKKNKCRHCKKYFTPAKGHPKQGYCSEKKCVLARRAKLQKQKMKNDKNYRKNQKESNKEWLAKNPDYWKKYRKTNPGKTKINLLKQQIRNQKRSDTKPSIFKVNLDEMITKMHLVKKKNPRQTSFWLLSATAEIDPIRVVLVSKTDQYSIPTDKQYQS